MFRSKSKTLVIPQSEHLRLVGALALLWGNADFDLPPVERASFVAGLGLHDRGYGFLDNLAIGDMPDEAWNEVARRGFYAPCSDPVADLIAKYHVRRLASHDASEARQAMTAEFTSAINQQLAAHGFQKTLFERMDRITNLCDKISFDFCFGLPKSGEVVILPRNESQEEVTVEYQVEDGTITAQPWPFSVDHYEGYILGYQADGYPERLDPAVLIYELASK